MSDQLRVVTNGLEGYLDPKRYGPRGKSLCILHEGTWMTPCEFRAKAKGHNQDSFMWKRQLKLPDLNVCVGVYIEQGHLKACDPTCQCPNCVTANTHFKARTRRFSAGAVGADDVTDKKKRLSDPTVNDVTDKKQRPSDATGNKKRSSDVNDVTDKKQATGNKKRSSEESVNDVIKKKRPSSEVVTSVNDVNDKKKQQASSVVTVDDVMSKKNKKAKDTDSDSGISTVSSTLVAGVTALPPPPPQLPVLAASPAVSPKVAEAKVTSSPRSDAAAKLTSSDLTCAKSSSVPDYTLMVREAIASVAAGQQSSNSGAGCSRLCVILYILTKYKPLEGGVDVVNEKVKSTIRLLCRMGIVGKAGSSGNDDDEASDGEDLVYLRPVTDEVQDSPGEIEAVKPTKANSGLEKTKVKTGNKKANNSSKQPELEFDDDHEIKFKPSQFYSNSLVRSPSDQPLKKKLGRPTKQQLANDSSNTKKMGRPPKLSNTGNHHSSSLQKGAVTSKISSAANATLKEAMSTAKENRDKVKAVSKVKKAAAVLQNDSNQKNNHIFRLKVLSPALAAICGQKQMTRNDAVSKLWHYIKSEKLQDPEEKFNILCDKKLRAVTNKDTVNQREILGLIGQHMTLAD